MGSVGAGNRWLLPVVLKDGIKLLSPQTEKLRTLPRTSGGIRRGFFFPVYEITGPSDTEGGGRVFLKASPYTMSFPLSFMVYVAGLLELV